MKEPIARRAGSALFWSAIRHAGAKAIFLVRLLVLARLLAPDDFGLLAISMVAVGLMTRLTDLGMIPALVQSPATDEIHYDVAWSVGVLRAAIIASAVFFAAPVVAQLFDEPRATALIQVLAIRPILGGLASVKVAGLVRDLRFRSLAFIYVPEALANTAIAIALAPSLGVWALVAGALAGPAAILVMSYVMAPYRPRFSLDAHASRSLIRFGRWIFLTGLVLILESAVLRLIVSRQLGTAALGLYYLGANLAFLPSEAARDVIGGVTFPLYARLQADLRKVTSAFRSVLTGTFALLLPVCALLISLAPALVEHVLGPRWEETVTLIRILAFASVLGLFGSTIGPSLKGVGRPSRVMIVSGVRAALLIPLIWIFTEVWGLAGAALAWLPAVAVAQMFNIRFAREVLPHPFAGVLKPLSVILAVSATGAVIAAWVYGSIPNLMGFVVAVALAVAGMGWALWFADRRLELGLAKALTQAFPQLAAAFNLGSSTA
jgi:O-antigen/teichoic acid export membrane protein